MLLSLLAACAPTLAPDPMDTALETSPGEVEETVDAAGLTISSVTVDATDHKTWLPFDLHDGTIGDVDEAEILIQRYQVALAEGVMAVPLAGADFDSLTVAPAAGYLADADDADKDGVPEYVLAGWYDYDAETHILTPADVVYALATADGDHFRLQFLDYYDDAGSSGHPSFRWGLIDPPSSR